VRHSAFGGTGSSIQLTVWQGSKAPPGSCIQMSGVQQQSAEQVTLRWPAARVALLGSSGTSLLADVCPSARASDSGITCGLSLYLCVYACMR
jgi:hypothetical protein